MATFLWKFPRISLNLVDIFFRLFSRIPRNGLRKIPQKGLREIPLNGLQEIPLNGFLGNNHKKISSPCPATVSVFIPEISQLRILPGKFSRKSPISVDISTGFSCERFLGISADSWNRLMLVKIKNDDFLLIGTVIKV